MAVSPLPMVTVLIEPEYFCLGISNAKVVPSLNFPEIAGILTFGELRRYKHCENNN
jgi:hypothetical protein